MTASKFVFPLKIVCDLYANVVVEATMMPEDFELPIERHGPYLKLSYSIDDRYQGGTLPKEAVYYLYYGPGFPHLYDGDGTRIIDHTLDLDTELIARGRKVLHES